MLRQTFVEFRAFLAAPRLIAPMPLGGHWSRWAAMVGLYLMGLLVIGAGLALWQRTSHVPAPAAFGGYSPAILAVIVVLVAPICEEAAFRGWLTGRPRALWLLGVGLVAGGWLVAVMLHWHDQVASLCFVATVLIALIGWLILRKRTDPPRWFARGFGGWFYLSVAVFGLSHLANYPHLSWALVPMVLPQVWAGLVFGYLRMRHGLIASILAHAAGNAAALATALLIAG